MLIDIHSHDCSTEPGVMRVYSISDWKSMLETFFVPRNELRLSVGVHPWEAAMWKEADREALRTVLSRPEVLMVGEIGLDKVCKVSLDVQQSIFQFQLEMAAECGKPVVLHGVKAMAELLAFSKAQKNHPIWILHGFRGGPQEAGQYLSAGFYLSFGKYHHKESLRLCPADRLFLETDESGDIRALYKAVAGERGISTDELETTLERNFSRLFPAVLAE